MHPVHIMPTYFFKIHFNNFSSLPRSPKWSPSLKFPKYNFVSIFHLFHICYMPCSSHLPWFNIQYFLNTTDMIWLWGGWPQDWSLSPSRGKIFLLSTSSRPVLGPMQPPMPWILGALSPRVQQPGREAAHSPTTSAKVKNTWIYTITLP
jgi:hypothetical protein